MVMQSEYLYLARQPAGQVTRGTLLAASAEALRAQIQARGWQLISFREAASRSSSSGSLGQAGQTWTRALSYLPPRSRDQEMALRQLSMLLRSGLDLMSALRTVTVQTSSTTMKRVMNLVIEHVASGESLGQAMTKTRAFPDVAVQLVGVGEQTGHLADVLDKAALHMSERRTMISEVRVALAYPLLVATAAVAIAIYLIFGVIPELQKFLSAMGRKLPAMTQSLVDLALWFKLYGAPCIVVIVSLLIGLVAMLMVPTLRVIIDRWILRMPIIGGVLRLAGTATLASSLSIMLRSGVQLVPALSVAERLQSNRFLAGRVCEARHSVLSGEGLASSLVKGEGYLPMLGSMVEVAQQTGALDTTLEDVSQFCQSELKARIKRLSLMVEPAIIVVAGCIVGYVYMAFFMALMSAGGNLR